MTHPPDGRDHTDPETRALADGTEEQGQDNQTLVRLVDLAKGSVNGPLTMLTIVTDNGGVRWIGGDHLQVSDICRQRLVAAIIGEDVPPSTEPGDLLHPEVISDVLTLEAGDPRLRWIAVRIADRGALIACDWEPWDPDERVAAILVGFAHFIETELVRKEFRETDAGADDYDEFKALILNSARDGVMGLNRDGTCRFVNEKAAELLGYPADQVIGRSASEFFDKPGVDLERELLSFREGNRVELDDVVLRRRDGETIPVELSVLPNIERSGEISGAVLRFFDLSERKAALAAARHSEARHKAFLEMTLDSIITVDQHGHIIEFNQAAEKTFGCDSDDILGEPMAEMVFPQPWRDWFQAAFDTLAETGAGPLSRRRIQMTALRFNGETFPAELTITRLPSQEGWIFTIYIQDLTERKWNERWRIARYSVTRILAESESPSEALPKVVEAICQSLEWDWSALWIQVPDTDEMQLEMTWNRDSVEAGPLEIASRQNTFGLDYGLLGSVQQARAAIWIEDLSQPNEYLRARPALACGFRSLTVMPIIGRHEVLGVIEFHSQRRRERDDEMLRLLNSLGSQIGQFIERRRVEDERLQILTREQAARAEAEAAERRLAFLAEASAQLSASLDYEDTVAKVVRFAVPKLADYCALDMLDNDGNIVSLEIADIDPEKEQTDRELQERYPVDRNSDHPVAQVFRTGRPLLYPEVTEKILRQLSGDNDEHFQTLFELGVDSSMYVPLIARERTIGVLSFVASESGHRYGQADLALAMELARRAALAIDNARLYREARDAVRSREEFLSIASHELKTPLTTVKGYAQILTRMLRRPDLDPERLAYLAEHLQEQLGRFETLIADLLDISRIQQGGLELRPETVDLIELTETVLNRFKFPADSDPVHTFSFYGPASYIGVWDPARLDQVLTNLLSNAVKYSPGGGEIVIRVEPNLEDQVHVSVTDPGIGIPPGEQERLFQPFARSETVQRAISGVGLGLYISRQIIERHGGSIMLDSMPERGSTFTVVLPRNYQELRVDDPD